MTIEQVHPQWMENQLDWDLCNDVQAGQRAVKDAAETYLPLLDGIESASDKKYQAYLARALVYGAFPRTVQGMVGAVFRKPWGHAALEGEQWAPLMRDATLSGESLEQVEQVVMRRVMVQGRHGLLADYSASEERPYLVGFQGDAIRDWDFDVVDGVKRLRWIILEESVTVREDENDRFSKEQRQQFRELFLDDDDTYAIRIHTADGHGNFTESEERRPNVQKEPLGFIPFVFLNPFDLEPDISPPPLLDLAHLVIDHYRIDADLKNGLHISGLPTPYLAGFKLLERDENGVLQQVTKVPLGGSDILISPDAGASGGFLQVQGGFDDLQKEKDRDERLMAAVGARLLQEPKAGVESAAALQFRAAGEQSALATIAQTVAQGIGLALRYAGHWLPGEIDDQTETAPEPNVDFVSAKITPQEIQALMSAYLQDVIDLDTFLYNLQRGEVLRPEDAVEDVRQRIEVQQRESAALALEAQMAQARAMAEAQQNGDDEEGDGDGEGGGQGPPAGN